MDGRTQEPVITYLKKCFNADYVDMITEAGPNRILSEGTEAGKLAAIEARVRISVEQHSSVGIAVVGHHDCAGNPCEETEQPEHTSAAVQRISRIFPTVPVIGLWVDADWSVHELEDIL
jgi:hypothetical protein